MFRMEWKVARLRARRPNFRVGVQGQARTGRIEKVLLPWEKSQFFLKIIPSSSI